MEEQKPETPPPSEAPTPPKKGRTGLWIVVAVVIIVVALLAVYFSGVLTTSSSSDLPQAVYLIGYPGDAIKIVPSWYSNRAQWPVKWMYSEGLEVQSFIDQLSSSGVDVSPIEGTAPVAPLNATYNTTSAEFNAWFNANYSHQPALFSSNSYDAVFVIALAMEKANTTNTNSTAFKQALRDVANPPGVAIYPGEWSKAVSLIKAGTDINYFGASGSIDFDQYGEVSSDYMVWDINAQKQIAEKLYIPAGSWNATGGMTVQAQAVPAALSPKIGTVLPITGSLAAYGGDMQNATDMAASQINAQGGIQGAMLQMVHQDSGTDPTTGANAATAEISAGVQAIVGAAASSVSQTVFAKVAPAGIIEITPASTSPFFTTADSGDQFWRTVASDALQGQAAAYYAYNKAGYTKMSVMYINNAYGQGLSSVFEQGFKARGGTIYRSVSFEAGQTSYTAQLQTLFTPGIGTSSFTPMALWRDQ